MILVANLRARVALLESAVAPGASLGPLRWSLLALMVSIIALVLTPWGSVLDTDAATFAVIGQSILEGGAPYRDIFDSKPPLFYLLNAASMTIGGSVGLSIADSVRVLSVVSTLIISISLAELVRNFGGGRVAMILAAIGAALTFSVTALSNGGGISEPPAFALALLAWILAERSPSLRGAFSSGTLTIAAAVTSFLVFPIVIGVGLTIYLRRSAHIYMAFLAGALLASMGLFWYLIDAQVLQAAFDQLVTYNSAYAATDCPQANSPGWPCYGYPAWRGPAIYAAITGLFFFIPLMLAPWRRTKRLGVVCLLLALMTIPSLMRAPSNHYFWPGILAMLPLSALGAERLWKKFRAATGVRFVTIITATWALGLVVGLWGGWFISQEREVRQEKWGAIESRVLADLAHQPEGRPLFVWGKWSNLYLDSSRSMAVPMVNDFALMTPGYTSAEVVKKVCILVAEQRPIIVTDGSGLSLALGENVTEGLDLTWYEPLRQMINDHWNRQIKYGYIEIFVPLETTALDKRICDLVPTDY